MTNEQFYMLMRYIDLAIDAKLEAMEEGPDGYRGYSNREELARRELEKELRSALTVTAK